MGVGYGCGNFGVGGLLPQRLTGRAEVGFRLQLMVANFRLTAGTRAKTTRATVVSGMRRRSQTVAAAGILARRARTQTFRTAAISAGSAATDAVVAILVVTARAVV